MSFEPIRTERLVLRQSQMSDAEAAYERRNLPEVAKYQDWELPNPMDRTLETLAKLEAMDGPVDGQGWSVTVVSVAEPTEILGDLYVGLEWGGRSAEIGFTFHPDHWGQGFATEAASAMIEYLFTDVGVSRVRATLHPDNVASARVLEACGLIYEGMTLQSFWVGDECSDDLLYGMSRTNWDMWRNRSRTSPDTVELVPLSYDNQEAVAGLRTHWSQRRFVATMGQNFEDALMALTLGAPAVVPWYRAIEADGQIVGFLMATERTDSRPVPILKRLLIDRLHQRRGIGSAAMSLFEKHCRDEGASAVGVAWVEGPGSPAPMYRGRGYEPTGEQINGEIQAVKQLDPNVAGSQQTRG